jgi:3'-phosphoadenosine 5'-phosphosulfate (PAPS) 3'-phosphatase
LDGTKEFVKRNGEFTVMIGLVAAPGVGGGKGGSGGSGDANEEEQGCRAVAGAVHVPCTGKTYYAAEGQGAYVREGADMSARAQEEIEAAYNAAADPAKDGAATATAASSSSSLRSAADALADRGVSTKTIACAEFSESDPNLALVASASHLSAETEAFCARFQNPTFKQVGSSLKMMLVAEGSAHCYPRLAPTMEWDTAAADVIVREAGGEVLRAGKCDGKSGKLLPGEDWSAELERARPVAYNKRDLLNPYFVCWGKRK